MTPGADCADELTGMSPTVSLVRLDDEWLIEDPSRGGYRRLDVFPGWLARTLVAMAGANAMDWDEVTTTLQKAGVPRAQAGRCLESLLASGMLTSERGALPARDSAALRDYQFSIVSYPVNYRDP